MNINELIEDKDKLEKDILDLIENFESKYEFQVFVSNLSVVNYSKLGYRPRTDWVNIEVKLN